MNRVLAVLSRFERAIVLVAFVGMVGVVFADVAARELTGVGLPWARQAGVYFNIFVVLFGIGLASASGSHLRPRFADHWLPARWERQLAFLQHALFALFCIGFAVVAADMVVTTYRLDERSEILRLPVWPIQSVIPLVFLIAAVRHGVYALRPSLRPLPPSAGQGEG
ncbi:MAG: TRAP transporter small permease [Gammaproteobacteria bacterium]